MAKHTHTTKQRKRIVKKISLLRSEGKPQRQAVAQAIKTVDRKDKKKT